MTTSIVHTAEQESAIRFLRRKHNAANGTSLTAGQYADLVALRFFNGLVAQVESERANIELVEAYRAADNATKAAVKTALGIQDP